MTKLATKTDEGVKPAPQKYDSAAIRVYKKYLPQIQKRDGRVMPFEFEKIAEAIHKAMIASGEGSQDEAEVVAHKVVMANDR
jgi:hypothetical protein